MLTLIKVILILVYSGLLTSCVNACMTGAQMAYNHSSIERSVSDQVTTMRLYQALNHKSDDFKDSNVAISTYNNEVLLVGQVPEEWKKQKAEEIAKRVLNVKNIHNLLTIGSPSSTLTRLSDSWITAKIKAKLIANNNIDATKVKVVTENGAVYLMGILEPNAAQAAVDIARTTDGVVSVVKIFSYMHITDKA